MVTPVVKGKPRHLSQSFLDFDVYSHHILKCPKYLGREFNLGLYISCNFFVAITSVIFFCACGPGNEYIIVTACPKVKPEK